MDILDFSDIDFISIHAPRAGSDDVSDQRWTDIYKFQSTPPVRGRQGDAMLKIPKQIRFQSTPPVRGATNIVPPL